MDNINIPIISILVANYNNGNYFVECYKSLQNQTISNFEVIIVDDCSTDNSLEIIKKLIENDNRCKLFENTENKGAGYTKRKCAEFATGEFCGFVDPDDALESDALETMVNTFLQNPNVDIVYSNLVFCDENLVPQQVRYGKQVENNKPDFYNLLGEISHFLTYRKSCYNKTIGIDGYIYRAVDQDLYLKLYEKGECLYINKNLYLYRIHQSGISTFSNQDKAQYWHWFVINDAARRRGNNVENLFSTHYVPAKKANVALGNMEKIKKSKWVKLGRKLGLIKNIVWK